MKVNLNLIYGGAAFFVLMVSLVLMDKGLFVVSSYTGTDGFYNQMAPFISGFNFSELQQLQYVHFIRFVVVYPFLFGEVNELGGGYASVVILLYSLPILRAIKKGNYNFLKYIILLVPIFLSFRSYLVACAIAYFFIAIYHHKSKFMFFLSLLLSILSSGVIMIWALLYIINFRSLRKNYRVLTYLIFVLMVLIFVPSLLHKQEFAKDAFGGYSEYFLRGTFVESILKGWWSRVAVYGACMIGLGLIVVRVFFKSGYSVFYLSYAPFFVGAMFEGLGFICSLIVLIMFYSGFRPSQQYIRVPIKL